MNKIRVLNEKITVSLDSSVLKLRLSMFMKTKFILPFIAFFILMSSGFDSKSQNLDLINGKEFDDMGKLNPAFTGILEELRLLAGQNGNLRAGIESKVFKSANYIGFNFDFDEIDHLKRQSFQFNYAREKEIGEDFKIKFAATGDYEVRTFNRRVEDTSFSFVDFNGNTWDYLQGQTDFKPTIEGINFGFGVGAIYKNLVFGLNANNINQMNINLLEGGGGINLPIEINAQFGGFFNLPGEIKIFPNAIFSYLGNGADETMLALGLGATKGDWSLNGQYEMFEYGDENPVTRLDIGVYGRIDRFLVGLSYLHWSKEPSSSSELNGEDFRITLNTTIFKKKMKKATGIFSDLRKFY